MQNIPGLIRLPVFAVLLVFSLIVLGLDAYFVSKINELKSAINSFGGGDGGYNPGGWPYRRSLQARGSLADAYKGDWAKLGVAVSVITIVSIIPMLVIDLLRKGAPTSFVVVELAWLGVLWVLWLATAAETASVDFGCSTSGIGGAYCSKFQAAEAFAFLAWLLLLAYWAILLAFAIIAVNNGQSQIWFSSVTDADFSAGSGGTGGVGGGGVGGAPYPQGGVGYPPQQQQPMMTGTAPPPGGSPPGAPVTGSFYPQQNV